jgi:hypothetical protein
MSQTDLARFSEEILQRNGRIIQPIDQFMTVGTGFTVWRFEVEPWQLAMRRFREEAARDVASGGLARAPGGNVHPGVKRDWKGIHDPI